MKSSSRWSYSALSALSLTAPCWLTGLMRVRACRTFSTREEPRSTSICTRRSPAPFVLALSLSGLSQLPDVSYLPPFRRVQWFEWADGVVFVYDCHSAYSFDMIPRFRNGSGLFFVVATLSVLIKQSIPELCNLKGTKDYPMVLVANQGMSHKMHVFLWRQSGIIFRCIQLREKKPAGRSRRKRGDRWLTPTAVRSWRPQQRRALASTVFLPIS